MGVSEDGSAATRGRRCERTGRATGQGADTPPCDPAPDELGKEPGMPPSAGRCASEPAPSAGARHAPPAGWQGAHPPLRIRAFVDLALVIALSGLPVAMIADPHEAILVALVVAAVGIVWFVARREADMARRAAADRWRIEAVEGRGVSLAEWHSGAALAPWGARHRAD